MKKKSKNKKPETITILVPNNDTIFKSLFKTSKSRYALLLVIIISSFSLYGGVCANSFRYGLMILFYATLFLVFGGLLVFIVKWVGEGE